LLVSGRRSLQPQQVRLQQLLPELIDSFRPVLGNKVTVKLSVPDDAWSVLLDPTELEVALANLLTNARDALDSEGAIVVSVANMAAPSEDQACVAIEVRDEGRGIPSAMLERVFEPFFTTKSPGNGTGLGLAQVYAFARDSGGKVAVDSEVGQGTKVRIELPRDGDRTPRQSPDGSGSPHCQPAQGTNVLVVDDNADVAESTSLLLRDVGCTVRTAANADQALLIMASGPIPDVILSDIFMPGEMDGLALARQVRQRHPSVRIVLASGYSDAAAAAKKEGFVVLQKPYELPSMLRAVAQT
jgi:CheY-like chemotaxis protein/two-component sensor histidine kinase